MANSMLSHRRRNARRHPLLDSICLVWLLAWTLVFALPAAQGDEIVYTNGARLSGKVLAFDGQSLTVQSPQGQVRAIPIAEVASFVIEPSAELTQKVDRIQQDLTLLGRMVDQLGVSWQEGRDQIRSEVTDLNPMTQVFVSKKNGFFRRNTFVIEGEIRNQSSVFIRDIHVLATFYDRTGVPVNEVSFPTLRSTIGPGSTAKFYKDIPNAPRFESFELTLLENSPQTTQQRGGAQKR